MVKQKKDYNPPFDINKLPAKEGILVFPISMSRISNSQSADKCFNYMKIFSPNKIIKPMVGLNFIYGDFLYFNSDEKASFLKEKFLPLMLSHKNAFLKILNKNPFYIPKAFSFSCWNQICLECKDFTLYLGKIREFYKKDKVFQKYIKEDAENNGKKLDNNQINFFLEEILLYYLLIKGQIKLDNHYVGGHEKWILWCYPGKPLKSQTYFVQKNPLHFLNNQNKYESSYYDLEECKLYDFTKILL